jgi:hypothetical protein
VRPAGSGYSFEETVGAIAKVTKKERIAIGRVLNSIVGEEGGMNSITTRDIKTVLETLGIKNPTGGSIQTVGEITKAREQGATWKR